MNRFIYVIILLVLALASYIIDFSKIFNKEKQKDDEEQVNKNTENDEPSESTDNSYHNPYADTSTIKIDTYINEYDNFSNEKQVNVTLKEAGLHVKAIAELEKQGYLYINQLMDKTDEELLAIKGIGSKTVSQIRGFKL